MTNETTAPALDLPQVGKILKNALEYKPTSDGPNVSTLLKTYVERITADIELAEEGDQGRFLAEAHPATIDALLSKYYEVLDTKLRHLRYVEEDAARVANGERVWGCYGKTIEEKLQEAKEAVRVVREPIEVLEAAYEDRGRWQRYFLVVSSVGHIHSSMYCSTCRWNTQYGWLPELSACEVDQMIAAYGTKVCTVCYPSAPTSESFQEAEAREKAAAQKKAEAECPNSRKYLKGYRWGVRYVKCPECSQHVAVTSTGKFRAHKRVK